MEYLRGDSQSGGLSAKNLGIIGVSCASFHSSVFTQTIIVLNSDLLDATRAGEAARWQTSLVFGKCGRYSNTPGHLYRGLMMPL